MDNGGKIIYMQHNNTNAIFKTPVMTAPFGLSDWDNTRFSVDLSMNADVEAFRTKMLEFEDYVIDAAQKNSMAWFKKQYTRDVVKELFSSAIRYPKDKDTGDVSDKYPPTMKLQVPHKNGRFACDAYDYAKETMEITKETLSKGSRVSAIVHASGVWVAGSKFGVTYKIVQMKIATNNMGILDKYAFIDDSDDECVV
ncbi:hypothetical protein FOA52_011851 [Chlamydomonas sp. UWO 241]|nr:hypothetical protein FOA52_007622 [Chlamydomonas sp. UWO 241]KAG1654356.1 hypothetical protein FOA52_011851 [Chlamydomonas sp. UWO 241]